MPRHSALTLLVALALQTRPALRGAAPSFAKATAGEPTARVKDVKVERVAQAITVSWSASPEKGVTSYVVATGPANVRGLEGWDWARTRVP